MHVIMMNKNMFSLINEKKTLKLNSVTKQKLYYRQNQSEK